jgi:MYXO-CTERM domain-containing protein
MNKLLAFVLVLGMTAVAQASLVLSVNGVPTTDPGFVPPVLEAPSGELILDVHLLAPETLSGFDISIVLDNQQGSIDGSNAVIGGDPWDFPPDIHTNTSQEFGVTASQLFGAPKQGPLVLVDNILFHCNEATPVIVQLIANAGTRIDGVDVPAGTVMDEILITQTPEPMTLGLLGLGGLGLLRRRR